MAKKQRYQKINSGWRQILPVVIVLLLIAFYFLREEQPAGPVESFSPAEGSISVHFIDVGQAQSILIRTPEQNILIDAGENNQGETVTRYLTAQGVTELDWMIGTHLHSDHIGGMDYVLNAFPAQNVMLPRVPDAIIPTSQTYLDVLEAIDAQNLQITEPTPGDRYDLGGGAEMTILAPVLEIEDHNEMSIVCRIDFGDTSFLLTGDAETGSEEAMLASRQSLRADVLGVGHHGSSTSTSDAFLQAVSPRYAVISCGIDNKYGHPHQETLEKLAKQNISVLRTDIQGSIVFSSDGHILNISTEK